MVNSTPTEPFSDGSTAPKDQILEASIARKALSGFFLAGLLMSFVGAILPAWGYHLSTNFSFVGLHFLAMALGIICASTIAHRLAQNKGVGFVLVLGAGSACAALVYLSLVSLQVNPWWNMPGLIALGFGSGLLFSGLFYSISRIYRHDPAATVNIAGVLFVLGSLAIVLLVAGTFYIYSVGSILFLLALIPGFFAGVFAKSRFSMDEDHRGRPMEVVWQDFRSPAAWMFALLLFFQFGNEWTVAGWLPVFLIQRIGVNPASSLLLLAFYWLALLVGRVAAQSLLPRFRHSRILALSVAGALFGCLILSFTKSVFGAVFGILFLGTGFAVVYPLLVERTGFRFPYFHPGLFNGIFSFAMVGGLMAPWTLGYLADWLGIRVMMLLPLAGTLMVSMLLVAIWAEARLSGKTST